MNGISLDTNTYDAVVNVKHDALGYITEGLSVGDTTYQNQALILGLRKGEFKEYPTFGVGLEDCLNDNDFVELEREIRKQFKSDGLWVKTVEISHSGIKIEANYK